jgi:hypothetical protein
VVLGFAAIAPTELADDEILSQDQS